MGAYKKLNKQDAYITTHIAHKTWAIPVEDFAKYGIVTASAEGIYLNSLQQLYYPSKNDGEIVSHSYDYYDQTTLNFTESRNLSTGSYIISIPREMYGDSIQPGLNIILTSDSTDLYVVLDYWEDYYTDIATGETVNQLYILEDYFRPDYIQESTSDTRVGIVIADDKEGNLYQVGTSPRNYVGDIIYSHGLIILTDLTFISTFQSTPIKSLLYKTSHPIFTHTYHCRVRESELNHTYNPSALTSSIKTSYTNTGAIYSISASYSDGSKSSNITGSEFQPYITTVGLYNDANQLIAVGKLSQPVPKSANTEMTITVKIDI